MSSNGPVIKKILICSAIDKVQHNPQNYDLTWMPKLDSWLDFYEKINTTAHKVGVQVVYPIISKKKSFDDLCVKSAKRLKTYLSYGINDMYTDCAGKKMCLVEECGERGSKFTQHTLDENDDFSYETNPTNQISHFVLTPLSPKINSILKIARFHQIEASHCFVLDADLEVLKHAEWAGMVPVDYSVKDDKLLKNSAYVQEVFDKNQGILLKKLTEILTRDTCRNHTKQVTATQSELASRLSGLLIPPSLNNYSAGPSSASLVLPLPGNRLSIPQPKLITLKETTKEPKEEDYQTESDDTYEESCEENNTKNNKKKRA